jgi:hypothetical protein
VKVQNVDLLADSHNIFNMWKKYFSQLSNEHNVSDARQIDIYRAKPLVLYQSPFLLILKLLLQS